MSDIASDFRLARGRGVPLLAVTTPDPAATIARLIGGLNGSAETTPLVRWDCVGGYSPVNDAGKAALAQVSEAPADIVDPISALLLAAGLPAETILFADTLDAYLQEPGAQGIAYVQAVRRLRDAYKQAHEGKRCRQLVILCPSITLPERLKDDVLVLDEPLPGREERAAIVERIHQAVGMGAPEGHALTAAVDTLAGLPAFAAEQATALSLRKEGLDIARLGSRMRQMVNQTEGLEVRSDPITFADIAGVQAAKGMLARLAERRAFDTVVWLDEVEKVMAGSFSEHVGDSGVSKNQLAQLLTWMQDRMNADALIGMIFLGPPGTAKSALAMATGNMAGVPVIRIDSGATKTSEVGGSERIWSRMLKVIDAISERSVLLIATANALRGVDSALASRFGKRYYFDLPNEEENAGIWTLKRARYGIPADDQTPASAGWTGREIGECCRYAALMGETLAESARSIVPVAVTAREEIEALRAQADGKLLSASYPGTYTRQRPDAAPAAGVRGISLE